MRAFGPLVVVFWAPVILVIAVGWVTPVVQTQVADAAAVLAAARDALGGDKRIEAVRTFIVTGRTRQIRGENLVPIEFEIQVEVPDKYARRDEFPAQDAGPATAGFNGERLIQIPPAPSPVARAGALRLLLQHNRKPRCELEWRRRSRTSRASCSECSPPHSRAFRSHSTMWRRRKRPKEKPTFLM